MVSTRRSQRRRRSQKSRKTRRSRRLSRRGMRGGAGEEFTPPGSYSESESEQVRNERKAYRTEMKICQEKARKNHGEFRETGQKGRSEGQPCHVFSFGNDDCANPLQCQYVDDQDAGTEENQCRPAGTTPKAGFLTGNIPQGRINKCNPQGIV